MNARPLASEAIFKTWWPLALSWLFMTSELALTTAVIARLAAPEINLAAWGIIFAISTVIQAPAVMLLPASTALSTDGPTYAHLRRIVFAILAVLSALHALIAFTPLYDLIVAELLGAPAAVVRVARHGLMIMVLWSFGTGYRRFLQGALIRFGHSRVVIWGTLIRLSCVIVLLGAGVLAGAYSGVVVAATAIIVGVLAEAVYTQVRARSMVTAHLRNVTAAGSSITLSRFFAFYSPLVLMTLLTMGVQTIVAGALGHLPQSLDSLAVWPVVFGFLLVWQSPGIAYTEVVISMLDEPEAVEALRRFTWKLYLGVTLPLLLVAATPMARLWFVSVAGLSPELAGLAHHALWLGLILPGLRVLQSWYQGAIMYSQRTQGIMESVLLFLSAAVVVLLSGVAWGRIAGIYVGMAAFVLGLLVQVVWLRIRSGLVTRPNES